MKIILLVLLISISLSAINNGYSQIYPIHHYSTEQGIATRSVFDITQDRTGRMWFATGIGVSEYDGYSWTNYGENEGVPKNKYSHILCDDKNTIWASPGTIKDQVIYFKNGKWGKIPKINNPCAYNIEITGFELYYENNNPVICISTYVGAYIYENENWASFNKENGLISDYIYSLTRNGNEFYLATKSGISIINKGKVHNEINNLLPFKQEPVYKITFDNLDNTVEKKIWMLGSKKIGYLKDSIFIIINDSFKIPNRDVLDFYYLLIDSGRAIYFGNSWFRYCLNTHTDKLSTLSSANGFSSDGNTSIYKDREGNIWFSDYRGIDKVSNFAFLNHSKLNGLAENEVTAITEFEPGVFAFGHNHGITVFKDFKFKYFPFSKISYNAISTRVLDFLNDNSGNLLFSASYLGVGKLTSNGNISFFKIPNNDFICSLCEDRDGNIYASGKDRLYLLENGVFRHDNIHLTNGFPFRKLFSFKDDVIWGVSSAGILKIKENDVVKIKSSGSVAENNCYSIFKDNDNRVFAGTEKGLFEIINDSLIKFSAGGFSINDAVYAITKDEKSGNYWFGTNVNLIRWDGANQVKMYNSKNGLVSGEINRSALCADSESKLWIGTDAGLSRYIPDLDYANNKIPFPEIVSVEDLLGNSFKSDDNISLSNGNATLKFKIRGISFIEESLMEYKIMLENYDKDWVIIKQNDVSDIIYKNLQPGNYRFRMTVRNYSSDWSNEIRSAIINVKGAFYKQWWFLIVVILLFSATAFYLYKRYLKRIYTKSLENQVQKRTEELTESKKELKKTLLTLEDKVSERTKELHNSEQKFRAIIEQAADGIVIYDMNSRKVLLTNQSYADMLGYTKEEMLDMTLYDIVAHDRNSIDDYTKNVVCRDHIYIKERFHKRKNSSVIPVEVSVRKIIYSEVEAMCVFVRDISERVHAQNELKLSEERYRTLIENADDIILLFDTEFNIIIANNKYYQSLGFGPNTNVYISELTHPDEEDMLMNAKDALLKEGNNSIEFRLKHSNGNWLYFSSKSIVIKDFEGNPAYIMTIYRDITEKKKIEKALYESEKKFRELVEILPAAVYETDTNGFITFANLTGTKLFGYDNINEIIGKNLLNFALQNEQVAAAQKLNKTLSGFDSEAYEFHAIKKDNTIISIYINAVPIFDNGSCTGVRGVVLDITEQKANEEKLKIYAEELKKLNAAKDKFFSIVAHDLRAPYTGFLGFSEILHSQARYLSVDEIESYAGLLLNSAKNNYSLIENLLQWGSIQTGSLVINKERVDLYHCVNDTINLLAINIQKKEITAKNEVPENVIVIGNKAVINSILQNLITNAVKFSNKRGVINIVHEFKNDMIFLSIIDNGVGISEDNLQKIFRLDAHITTRGTNNEAGTGLGLLVCKDMIEKLGGTISISSIQGEGTTLTFSLPLAE